MKRSALIQFRLEPELKNRLLEKGDMSAYLRSLVEADLGLNNGNATEAEREAGISSPGVASLGNAVLNKLVKQLEAQGKEPTEARELAKRRLGL